MMHFTTPVKLKGSSIAWIVFICVCCLIFCYISVRRPNEDTFSVAASIINKASLYEEFDKSSTTNLKLYLQHINNQLLSVEHFASKAHEEEKVGTRKLLETETKFEQLGWKFERNAETVSRIIEKCEVGLKDAFKFLPSQKETFSCPQCLEMVCLEQCRYNGDWCRRFDRIERSCMDDSSHHRLADSVQQVRSAQNHFPAPRCYFSEFDSYTKSNRLRLRYLNNVLDLLLIYAYKKDGEFAAKGGNFTLRCSDILIPHRPFQINRDKVDPVMSPMMLPDELEFLVKLMINLAPEVYVEFGSGGSTNFFPLLADRAYSIEHDSFFCAKSMGSVQQCLVSQNRLKHVCLHGMEEVNAFERQNRTLQAMYVRAFEKIPEQNLDLVLVDGRVRLSCALYALRRISLESVVLIHDFFIRAEYNAELLLQYYEVIGHTRTLVALRKRQNLPQGWYSEWEKHLGRS